MTEINWDEPVDVFWGVEHVACGHLGIAARDRSAMEGYMMILPAGWRIVHPTRRQLKDAHDNVTCEHCKLPDIPVSRAAATRKHAPSKKRKGRKK